MKQRIDKWIYRVVSVLLLLPGLRGWSQTPGADSLQQQFLRYQLNAFQEKLFVHTNKTLYLAGEIAWFRVYDVDASLHRPAAISSSCQVELINREQHSVLQTRLALREGGGNGSLMIPSSLPSGHYLLRAYTSWMKNMDPAFYFEQQLTIINTLKEPAPATRPLPPAYSVQFFPEGGNLVEGLPSRIAFKITNRQGQGVPGNGVLIAQQKDTLATLVTLHGGMGSFLLTPARGKEYNAVITVGDTILVQKLPAVYAQGYTMRLVAAGNDKLQVTVFSNMASAATVYLLVHTRQLLKAVQSSPLMEGKAVFVIDRDVLGDGVSHFTLFNADRQPVCERLYFKRPEQQLQIRAATDSLAYGIRQKVTLSLQTEDSPGNAVKAALSMSVFQIDSLQPAQYAGIGSYLLLVSDLKGAVENPAFYLEKENEAAADNLMLTQGWRRFRWEDVLQGKHPYFEFAPEKEGIVVNARITDRRNGQPVKNVMGWLSVPGQQFVLSTATSGANGELRFNTGNFYGRNEIIAQTNGRTDSMYRVDIGNAYSDKFSATILPDWILPRSWKEQLEYRSINAQADNAYRTNQKEQYSFPAHADTTVFYGPPDKRYNLDDYTRFVTMEEVMREYVIEVKVRRAADKFNFHVLNAYFKNYFDNEPLVLLDGVPVFDVDKIMAMDPQKLKQIDIMYRRYYLGGLTSDGIVSYKTYTGDLGGYPLDPNAVVVEYDGLQREREFYTPVYETPAQLNSRIPDTRNALAWLPDIKTNATGKTQLSFYTSDLKGQYAIIIEGITSDGLPGSTLFRFNVR